MTTGFDPGAYVSEDDYLAALTEIDGLKAMVSKRLADADNKLKTALVERDELLARLAEYVRRAREIKARDVDGPLGVVKLMEVALNLISDLAAEEKEK